jgi:hypothetical protein
LVLREGTGLGLGSRVRLWRVLRVEPDGVHWYGGQILTLSSSMQVTSLRRRSC